MKRRRKAFYETTDASCANLWWFPQHRIWAPIEMFPGERFRSNRYHQTKRAAIRSARRLVQLGSKEAVILRWHRRYGKRYVKEWYLTSIE